MILVDMLTSMKKGFAFSICLAVVLVSVVYKSDFAVEIVPATAHDILGALGPDARGLSLPQESLPDLFALTASRIEENAKQFIVEEPYLEGRWKGGKAVIEYARDLSYTLVSVYDKDGHRQRIYSVRTNYSDHVAHQQSVAQAPSQNQAQPEPDLEAVPETPSHEVSRETSAPSRTTTARPASTGASGSGYEWSEAQGTYVPVGGSGTPTTEASPQATAKPAATESESAPAPSTPKRKRHHHAEVKVASSVSAESSPSGNQSQNAVWIPPKAKTAESAATNVKVANTTWVEKKTDTSSEEAPAPPKHKHHRKHTDSKPAAAPETQAVASSKSAEKSEPVVDADAVVKSKASDEWVPKSIQQPVPETKKAGISFASP